MTATAPHPAHPSRAGAWSGCVSGSTRSAGSSPPGRAPAGFVCARSFRCTGEAMGEPIRVLVVDDQALVRQGFTVILEAEPDITVVGEAGDGAAAVDAALALRPDVVLMDVRMPGMDGIAATAEICARTSTRVLVLTTYDVD